MTDIILFGLVGTVADYVGSSIIWGVLIGLALTAVVFVILQVVVNQIEITPIGWVALGALLIGLVFQSTLWVASLKMKSALDEAYQEAVMTAMETQSSTGSNDILGSLLQSIPILGDIISNNNANATQNMLDLLREQTEQIKRSLTAFGWRRVAWAGGFMAAAIAAGAIFGAPAKTKRRSGRSRHAQAKSRQRMDF